MAMTRDNPRIKRPMNAFLVWATPRRRRLNILHPRLKNADISKVLGQRWRQMTNQQKNPYFMEASQLKVQHQLKYPTYKYQPRKQLTDILEAKVKLSGYFIPDYNCQAMLEAMEAIPSDLRERHNARLINRLIVRANAGGSRMVTRRVSVSEAEWQAVRKACRSLPANDDFRVAISDVAGEHRARLKQWNGKRQHALPKPKRVENFHPAGDVEGEGPGRPRKDISVEDVLHDILDLDYSVTDVAKKHQVSRSTIYRRLDEHGLNIQQERYTDISQQEIQEIMMSTMGKQGTRVSLRTSDKNYTCSKNKMDSPSKTPYTIRKDLIPYGYPYHTWRLHALCKGHPKQTIKEEPDAAEIEKEVEPTEMEKEDTKEDDCP
ncbi:Transcription factor SOX-13 [Branchiostoma belcheri]|nr:Transcription factor SOX-13 [Branchiostoma belcheri]